MKRIIGIASLLLLVACAGTDGTQATRANQPHLPPPGFPVTEAPMGRSCGGMVRSQGPECRAGEYCHRTIEAQCGAADAPGVCRAVPEACPMDYNPVCGCDGKDYPNACAANAKGVSAAYRGECQLAR